MSDKKPPPPPPERGRIRSIVDEGTGKPPPENKK